MSTKAQKIMVVLAHPDDETFGCGGTLAHYAAAGVHMTLVTATKGEMGRRLGVPPSATRETLPLVREAETRAACDALGVHDLRFLGLRDKTVDYYEPAELAKPIAALIKEVDPDVLITFHEVFSGHSDHCATGRAATLAHRQLGHRSRLYHLLWTNYEQQIAKVGASPEQVTIIDLDDAAIMAKVRALRAHRTQTELIKELWKDDTGKGRVSHREYFLQASGAARPGETCLLP